MWIKSHSVVVSDVLPHQIWRVWSDIDNRPTWDLDTEWAELKGPFKKGVVFRFKPKGGPKLSMTITECTVNQSFADCFKIPFARMYGIHEMHMTEEGLKISTSIKVEGLLGWLLRKIVAEKVVAEIPAQTAMLIQVAKCQP
ncbi:MAG: polyketide cyclase [Gammaproteobacteria bacterium]|nr:polyketide cyclase [Gammaproteobacteria bacterium]